MIKTRDYTDCDWDSIERIHDSARKIELKLAGLDEASLIKIRLQKTSMGRCRFYVEKDGKEYALPGGHVKIGETLEDGLIRETMEEMGIKIECKRLLWSEECF